MSAPEMPETIYAWPDLIGSRKMYGRWRDENPHGVTTYIRADMPPLDYARHMLGVARREARALLSKLEGRS